LNDGFSETRVVRTLASAVVVQVSATLSSLTASMRAVTNRSPKRNWSVTR
jgi:hypothetical protein